MKFERESLCESKYFEIIFNKYFSLVRNYIYYKGCDYESSEDIAQEAFIVLLNNCKQVKYNEALFYLKRIASNKFLNIVKHNKVVLNYKSQNINRINNESPDFIIEEEEFRKKLNKAINDLPEKQREVFLLNRIDKKTYKEIAAFLEITVKAVEKRMHNALKTLRVKIGNI